MNTISELQKFCRNEFLQEEQQDFLTLKRIPSTIVCRFLRYYNELDTAGKTEFCEAASLRAAMNLMISLKLEPAPVQSPLAHNVAWKKWSDWNIKNSWRFPSIPELRIYVGQATIDREESGPMESNNALDHLIASVRNIYADKLRKCVRLKLNELFSATARNRGGGEWVYDCNLNNSAVSVNVDYGGRASQIRYAIVIEESNSFGRKLESISYEAALGIGRGDWDFIVQENLDDSMRLLAEFVVYASKLPQRIPKV
jgi:hypothetical protein